MAYKKEIWYIIFNISISVEPKKHLRTFFLNINIKPLDINDNRQINGMIKWQNDPELQHLINPVFDKSTPKKRETIDSFRNSLAKQPENFSSNYIIFDHLKPIGDLSIQIDPDQVMRKIKGTSWLGLVIGEKEYWGRGVAKIAMDFFEKKSLEIGAKRIELGTFEFNKRAYHFYKKLGYIEIGRIEKFTYWKGKYWTDIRMEKIIG